MNQQLKGDRFSAQRPVGYEQCIALYVPHQEFQASLRSISEHISHGGDPMSFALYGAWGSGKSTALAYLEGLVREANSSVSFSRYESPLWAGYPDVRSTLALQILRGTGAEVPAGVASLLGNVLNYQREVFGAQVSPEDYSLATELALLDVLRAVPHAPPVIEEWIRSYLTRQGDVAHVVMVDDLDRCDPSFANQLLKATSFWTNDYGTGSGANTEKLKVYFVVACRFDHLLASQEIEDRDPHESLEKYIHVGVELPKLLNRRRDAAAYLRSLVDGLAGIELVARNNLTQMIEASGSNYPDGVLAPLLKLDDPQPSTPRAMKTRLNKFLAEMDPSQLEDLGLVKEWMIKAFWPDFWFNQYRSLLPVLSDNESLYGRMRPIREVGERIRELVGMTDRDLVEAMNHVANEARANITDVTPQLAIYLASSPPWPPETTSRVLDSKESPASAISGLEKSSSPPNDRLRRSAETTEHDDLQASRGETQDVGDDLPSDPDDQILFWYYTADSAENQSLQEEILAALVRLLNVAENLGSASKRGPTIGNAALVAERASESELASRLHQAARIASPDHHNIMANYLDFIVNMRREAEYDEAEKLLARLRDAGGRDFQVLILGLRLDLARGRVTEVSPEQTERLLGLFASEPTVFRLFDVSRIASVIGYESFRQALRLAAESAEGGRDLAFCLSVGVTTLGSSTDPRHEREVADIERWGLSTGLVCTTPMWTTQESLLNLGRQLSSLRYGDAAALLYEEVYRREPSNAEARRLLASILERFDRSEDGTAVLLGRKIEPLRVEPEQLPHHLSAIDGTPRWWEHLTDSPYGPPCLDEGLSWALVSPW